MLPSGGIHLDIAQTHGLGTRGRIKVEIKNVLAARRGYTAGKIGVEAVGSDAKGEVVVLGIDGEPEVGGKGIVIGKVDKIDIISAKALPAVGDEIECVSVGMQEGELLVAGGVDARAEILGKGGQE